MAQLLWVSLRAADIAHGSAQSRERWLVGILLAHPLGLIVGFLLRLSLGRQHNLFLFEHEIQFLPYSWITEVVWVLQILQNTMRLDFIKVLNIQALEERVDLHDILLIVLLVLDGVGKLREVVDLS